MEMDLGITKTSLTKAKNIKIPDIFNRRMKTGIKRIDVLFDEGILPGSAFTLTAQAGCGKTTLMMQILNGLAKNGYNVGYFSGEESIYQLAYTADRINTKEVPIANETDIDEIMDHMKDLDLLIIDSFQALTTRTKMNSRQLEKYAVQTLVKEAKKTECTVGFIMHLTKSGDLKGGTIVPHTVDANIKIVKVSDSDDEGSRCIYFEKNRFGPLNELECLIARNGFDFESVVVKDDSDGVKKVEPKATRKEKEFEKILDLESITQESAARSIGDVSRANFLLRELTVLGRVEKTGRGSAAVWWPIHEQINSLPMAAEEK